MKVKNKKIVLMGCFLLFFYAVLETAMAEINLPNDWQILQPIINSRINQTNPKMKLTEKDGKSFSYFLANLEGPILQLKKMKIILPKTTLELLRSVQERGVSLNEAEKMAGYLNNLIAWFKFQNVGAFDENTSHIIGREWQEIDYSGENMTWEKQKLKYAPDGIVNFKSREMLKKFFPVEAKLPYFNKLYRPQNTEILKEDTIDANLSKT